MSKVLKARKRARPQFRVENVAELLRTLGDVPADRVRMIPLPGLAKKADLLRLLEHSNIPCELVQGTLIVKALGQFESRVGAWLCHSLCAYLETWPIGRVFGPDAPHELKSGLIRMPDVAFVTHERVPTGPKRKKPVACWAPDLAVEIINDGDARREIERKLEEYFEADVRLGWIVDSRKRTVVVHTPGAEPVVLDESKTLDGGDVLPGFKLKIKDWFAKVD